jgi:protein disulfide-isomerase A1
MVLTDANYEETIKNNPVVMLEFYAPWCGHCKALAPEYETLAKNVKSANKKYIIAKIDTTTNTKAGEKFAIRGFPTLKLFIDGTPIDFDGERKADPIMAFIDKKVLPPSNELKTATEVKAKYEDKGRRVRIRV